MSTQQAGQIHVEQLTLALGQGPQRFNVLEDVSFNVEPGEFVCLLGPSGCGKSTLLSALAGHATISQGRILLDQQSITGPGSERGLVFQQHTLFAWKSVLDNVAFGLKMKGVARPERYRQARELLALVGLADVEQRYPHELSGGMQQRVEIARVLINKPSVLLMDEPFGALDAQTRLRMQELLLDIWSRIGTTVIFITHDIDEALFLADRILVMSPKPGRIIEEIKLAFTRPRQPEITTSAEFSALKRHCLDLLLPAESVRKQATASVATSPHTRVLNAVDIAS